MKTEEWKPCQLVVTVLEISLDTSLPVLCLYDLPAMSAIFLASKWRKREELKWDPGVVSKDVEHVPIQLSEPENLWPVLRSK